MDWDAFETETLAKCDAVDSAIKRRFAEFEQVRVAGEATAAQNRQNMAALEAISYGDTPSHQTQQRFGRSHSKLVLLAHDIEIAVSAGFVDQMIKLDAVFPPFEFPLSPQNVRQSS